MTVLSDGDRVHLVDRKGRQYALTLKAGDTFQLSGETLAHDDLIGVDDAPYQPRQADHEQCPQCLLESIAVSWGIVLEPGQQKTASHNAL